MVPGCTYESDNEITICTLFMWAKKIGTVMTILRVPHFAFHCWYWDFYYQYKTTANTSVHMCMHKHARIVNTCTHSCRKYTHIYIHTHM